MPNKGQPSPGSGRKPVFTQEHKDQVIEYMRQGLSTMQIEKQDGMPSHALIFKWVGTDPDFRDKYIEAKRIQAFMMAEQILHIADNSEHDVIKNEEGKEVTNHGVIARDRERIKTRMWLMERMLPRQFGQAASAAAVVQGSGNITVNLMHPDNLPIGKPPPEVIEAKARRIKEKSE